MVVVVVVIYCTDHDQMIFGCLLDKVAAVGAGDLVSTVHMTIDIDVANVHVTVIQS